LLVYFFRLSAGAPQRKNGLVAQICSQCGSISKTGAEVCAFCDAPLGAPEEEILPLALHSTPPEWRLEVARRLEDYRRRRGRILADDSQTALPFAEQLERAGGSPRNPQQASGSAARHAARAAVRAEVRPMERLEIDVSQPSLDFHALDDSESTGSLAFPVASLARRRGAALLDLLFLASTYGAFLGLFQSLGGHLEFSKVTLVIYGAAFLLFFAAYFLIFMVLGGATPGMALLRLTTVRFDGNAPDTGQLAWRSFGYVLSAATLLLGFLWALWDEQGLTWHDRMSQTFLTESEPFPEENAAYTGDAAPVMHRHAR
jgi:uncharacterized RDD family membrane protein YckC